MKRPHGRGPGSGSVLVWADRMFLPSRPMFGFQNPVENTLVKLFFFLIGVSIYCRMMMILIFSIKNSG